MKYTSARVSRQPRDKPSPRRLCLATLALLLTLTVGCASWRFTSFREQKFSNIDAEILLVEYGKEKRTEILPNGLVCTYEGKVRLHLPNGKRVVLYQTLANVGNRYLSANKRYEFIEKAPYGIVREDGYLLFEGIYIRR